MTGRKSKRKRPTTPLIETDDPFEGVDVADVSALQNKKRKITVRKGAKPVEEKEREEKEDPRPLDPNTPWISASNTRNYLLKDPLLDWFNLYSKDDGLKQEAVLNFTDAIMQQGHSFEAEVVSLLKLKFGTKFLDLQGNRDTSLDPIHFQQTQDAMRKGVPFLYQAVLLHPETRTYGIPDLIVRSDYINALTEFPSLTPEEATRPAPLLPNSKYHYRIIDIKFATLKLRANGIHCLNQGSIPAYKGQLYIYHRALTAIQGEVSSCCHLLGRRWSYSTLGETYSGESCFGRLGCIDYVKPDSDFPRRTDLAISWLRDLHSQGKDWDPEKPHRLELYPNMSFTADWPWHRAKQDLADKLKDLTCLWMVGVKGRELGHLAGIYRWDDPDLTAKDVGIKGEITEPLLDAIIGINRDDCKDLVLPPVIELPESETHLWVDFETRSSVLDPIEDMPLASCHDQVFMIGVVHYDSDIGETIYRDFTMRHFTADEEERIALEFVVYLKTFEGKIGLRHWSHHEYTQWDKLMTRHFKVYDAWCEVDVEWVDLLRLFKDQRVVVKGALGYGLKAVVKAMHKSGLIKTNYTSSSVVDGADALVQAVKAERESQETGMALTLTPTMKEIVGYNKIDCQVMYEIEDYLIMNHSPENEY